MTCQEVREEVAVSVLRGDPVTEEVTQHLSSCPACAAEAEELQAMRPLLETAVPVGVEARPDELALQRLLSAAHRESQTRRRRQWLAAAVAVVAALVLAVGTGVVVHQHAVGAFTPVTAAGMSTSTGVSGSVHLTASGAGSDLGVSVKGVAPGTRCSLVVIDASGQRHVAAWWRASYVGTATVTAHSDVAAKDVASIELTNSRTGQTLLAMHLA